jgi:AraC-like DNA-binding protein
MPTLLDSAQLDGAAPAATVAGLLEDNLVSRVVLHDRDSPIRVRLEGWEMGRLSLARSQVSGGVSLVRGHRGTVGAASATVSLWVQESGTGRAEQAGVQRLVPRGSMVLTDLTRPYGFSWGCGGTGSGNALRVPLDLLGLPMDVVRRAVPSLQESPLYDLVRRHVQQLARDVERITGDPVLPALAQATVELARALLTSAAGPSHETRTVLTETLLSQVRSYVRQHLSEPSLNAETIARAHAVSVRQLYRLCAAADISLEQWIIGQRLDGARVELAAVRNAQPSIAMVARRWGFTDPSSFNRRFRATFGMSPGEWRRTEQRRVAGPSTVTGGHGGAGHPAAASQPTP